MRSAAPSASRMQIAEPRQTWKSYAALGRLHAARKEMEAAHRAYRSARELIEKVKAAVRDPHLRAGLEQAQAIREIYERSGPEA